jgi:AcrR family transcriptional regulator
LKNKEFDKISVHEIADAASVNRATFYDHYADKFALLECMVGTRFHELLAERAVRFDRDCLSVLRALVLAVCDYLTQMQAGNSGRPILPHMESAIIAVVRRILLEGLKKHAVNSDISPEMIAATASWAIYGGARQWIQTPNGLRPEETADVVVRLVSPILHVSSEPGHPA